MAISLKTWLKRDIFHVFRNLSLRGMLCWIEISYVFEKKTSLILIIKYIFDTIIVSDKCWSIEVKGHVAALLTLKANWLDPLMVQQWKVMMNNDVVLFFCDQWGNTLWAAAT